MEGTDLEGVDRVADVAETSSDTGRVAVVVAEVSVVLGTLSEERIRQLALFEPFPPKQTQEYPLRKRRRSVRTQLWHNSRTPSLANLPSFFSCIVCLTPSRGNARK